MTQDPPDSQAPGGVGDSDDSEDSGDDPAKGRNPFGPRKRITLAFKGPPLALPGAGQRSESEPGPITPQRPRGEPADTPHDGWSRERAARGSGVHRPVSKSRFPPPLATEPAADRAAGGALDLVNRRAPSESALDLSSEMTDRFALDDFSGALLTAELILGREPDHQEAARYAELCRERLGSLYSTRLGGTGAIPRLTLPSTEVRWLGLDHRAGFLLSLIDGEHTIDELVDMAPMARLAVLKTLIELLEAGTITSQ